MSRACPHCSAALPDFADARCPNCHGELPPELRLLPPVPPAPPPVPLPNPVPEFAQSLRALAPRVSVTPVVLLLNVLLFIVMTASGADALNPKNDDLVNWGANYGPHTLDGEWWRLLASTFVHIGAPHLALNVLALAVLGPLAERLLGGFAFALLCAASAVGGGTASLLWNPSAVSAGAAGAVCGAAGALLGALLVRQGAIPLAALKLHGLAFLGYVLAFCFLPRADFAAHLSGLVFGFALGALMSRPLTPEGAAERPARALVGAGVAAVLVGGFALLAAALHVSASAALLELEQFAQLDSRVLSRYDEAVIKLTRREMREEAYVELMARDILPSWRARRERLEAFAAAPGALGKYTAGVVDYMRLRERSWEELVAASRTKDVSRIGTARALWQQADEAAARLGPLPETEQLWRSNSIRR
jgi:rhomboid protease GluP